MSCGSERWSIQVEVLAGTPDWLPMICLSSETHQAWAENEVVKNACYFGMDPLIRGALTCDCEMIHDWSSSFDLYRTLRATRPKGVLVRAKSAGPYLCVTFFIR